MKIVRTQIYLRKDQHHELRDQAHEMGISFTELLRRALDEYLHHAKGKSSAKPKGLAAITALAEAGSQTAQRATKNITWMRWPNVLKNATFIDAGAFIALADKDDQFYEKAGRAMLDVEAAGPRVTTPFVLIESCNFLQRRLTSKPVADCGIVSCPAKRR